MPAAPPGSRWVLVRDDRLTNRIRAVQIPIDAPDPVDPGDTSEVTTRTRALMQDLLDRRLGVRSQDDDVDEDPVGAGEGP